MSKKGVWIVLIAVIGLALLAKRKFSQPDPVEEQIRLMSPNSQQSAATNIPFTQRPNTPEQNMYSGQKVEIAKEQDLRLNGNAKKEWEKCFPKIQLSSWENLSQLQMESAKELGALESEDLLQSSKVFKNPEGKLQQLRFTNDTDRSGNQLVVMQLFEKNGDVWKEIELNREESHNPDANTVEKYLDRAPIIENLEKIQFAYQGGYAGTIEKKNGKVQKIVYSGGKGTFLCQPEQNGNIANCNCKN